MEADQHHDASRNAEPTANANDNSNSIEGNSFANGASLDPKVRSECKPGEILRNLENVSYIYRQDVVKCKTDGKIGLVTEVAGDSDSDSSLTDDEDEDEDEDEDDGEEDDDDDDDGGGGPDDDDDGGDSNTEDDRYNNEKAEEADDGNKDRSNCKSDPLIADHVRVLWMDESESTESIDNVIVVDRGFLHGDYVAAASDPTGQVGLVVDINISVDLLAHDGSIFKDVSSRELKRVRGFTVGDYVVLGPWLGRIDDVFDNVTVMFDDGSVCKVMKADPLRLKPVGRNGLEDGHFPFYPGQRVKASSSSVFKNSRWLSGSWKANRLEGTVTKVTVGSVFIYWIASAGYGPNSSTAPAEEQNPKNLKLMSCFSHAIWQLGDWCLLPSSSFALDKQLSKLQLSDSTKTVSESSQSLTDGDSEVVNLEESTGNSDCMEIDVESSVDGNCETLEHDSLAESSTCANSLSLSKESGQESWPLHRKKIRKVVVRRDKKARKKEENFERALLIVNTRTSVDVAWQDGKIEGGLESTSLIPIESPGDHEFVAEQYVVEKAADDADDSNDVRRVGVVKSVNAKERTASVRWLKLVTRAEDPKEFDKEEVVSVYELEGHPDYDYCYGDVVVRLLPVSLPAKMGSVLTSTEESEHLLVPAEAKEDEQKHSKCNEAEAAPSDDTCSQFSDLSWVGNITGLRNGDIEVTWADGMISLVGPQAIYVVDRDDDESIVAGSDVGDDVASWETVEDHERETLGNVEEELGTTNATDISIEDEDGAMATEDAGRNGALSIPLAALGFVTRLASGIFSRGRKQTDSSSLDSRSEDEEREGTFAKIFTGDESWSQRSGDLDNSPRLPAAGNAEDHDTMEVTDVIEANLTSEMGNSSDQHDDQTYSFKRFDITTDPYDHHFLGTSGQNNAGRKWLKKVQQDWNILQNNLPDGIYVRVYEDHMDLLRAVIVGAYGTPYQDGLFFFDFHLPPEYPDVPPSAYYHSGGWRINPNLYEEGKVCLSLLNTWTGRGNEVWDSSSSSILQVLVSLQGLVLNSRPYFNEAGYDKQVGTAEGEKNSLSYNENTFLLNCKTMMYLMRKPPKDFEELIREHFRMRGYYILKACDAYMKGFLIGSLIKDASVSNNSSANSNSVGFKLMLAKIVPKLFLALKEIGVECEEYQHLHQL
ncbi:probable ubiquitin-conjugating enzyme E2 23 [Solanum pennellii]|uniref:Probable ubiquitin-conjugating enzyme E2 23 n=1 Tax=Solanum pennellii TaxID=28526 RepID=A0ABM1FVP1_SOLPN|nr:probable ubiquitin-conjugating enzyme E2 23 [Solanum pennellii]XP_015062335.1 probable ubiquitin-conjugating enzyme E2 23 [Solanum pennellii]XP_015062337.1 probable ubiquitin-conjugating enzyme E2 23 [Solanum pennellii]XP_027767633.1 probable ubiquitin-conjugating enzyme E2 23 [Solanum pennellii]XP_027767636.1 probable ubiquitin-conjugating enzyme E2 23 [Solanum pennellii]